MRTCLIFFLLCACIHLQAQPLSRADSILEKLTIDQQIGQLFMLAAYSNKSAAYENALEDTIRKYHIGGLIFFQGTPVRQALMTNRYQQLSDIPLMIGMDAECGIGWRLSSAMEFPKQTLLGAIREDEWIYRIGQTIGRHCRTMGVHVNFAPVVDLNVNKKNPVIGIRSFGEETGNVSRKSVCYMQGLLSEQVMAVAKHFPGHGDTHVDSHLALPTINHSRARIDSVELAPFRAVFNAGIPGVLTAHLNIPALEKQHIPSSLSPEIVTRLLRDELGFEGLCFTDAMNMKGVTKGHKKGEADLKALLAGNDVILFPEEISASVRTIKKALQEGSITESFIREKCRRILEAKIKFVYPFHAPIDTTGLIHRLNTPEDLALKQQSYAKAITLIKNNGILLPLLNLDTLKIASLNFGDRKAEAFEETLELYTACDHYAIEKNGGQKELDTLLHRLASYNCIVIYNSAARNGAANQFGSTLVLSNIIRKLQDKQLILCHPATPYGVDLYSHLPLDAILIGYSHDQPAQEFMAQAIFGGIAINGKLPLSVNPSYPAGTGLSTPKIRLGYGLPESSGMNSTMLQRIDSICQAAITQNATPGCEVLVAKDGLVVYHKAFGHHTYEANTPNLKGDIYDIASVTKIAATLPAVMMLYDRKLIDLDKPISTYLSELKGSNKAGITPRELLLHMSGLKASFHFFQHAIDKEKLTGRLLTTRRTPTNTLKLRDNLYINPDFCYRDSTFCFEKKADYRLVSPHFYVHEHFRDSIRELLIATDLQNNKEYTYSDLGFIMLKDIVEQQSGIPFDVFLQKELYHPLGAYSTDFLADRSLPMERIVPSSMDRIYRKTTLHGFVHDPLAALLGGVAGHAGLFSSANDLAKLMAMYLNGGTYGGKHYIDSSTIAAFSCMQLSPEKNRRGLGFDKPDTRKGKEGGPACKKASPSSYGHTGFTGTIAWNDPEYNLIYIFLSNRTYPDEFNNTLIRDNIRTKIQEVLYDAIDPCFIPAGHS